MKALICNELGPPEILAVDELPDPRPGEGKVLIKISAAGLNFADILIVSGQYQVKPTPPFVPGCEVAGQVAALGRGVSGFAVGDPVVAQMVSGGFAGAVAVDAARVFPIQGGLDPVTAAASFITYGSAYVALRWRAALAEGETCLVLGGAGGVGLAAITLAKSMGARVIGAASSPERCAIMVEQGAEETLDYSETPLRDAIKALVGRGGVDVVIDPVGGELGLAAFRSLGWSGRAIALGFASGEIQSYPANILLVKNVTAIGSYFGSFVDNEPELVREMLSHVHTGLAEGSISAPKVTLAPMASVPDYLTRLSRREQLGKVVMSAVAEPHQHQ